MILTVVVCGVLVIGKLFKTYMPVLYGDIASKIENAGNTINTDGMPLANEGSQAKPEQGNTPANEEPTPVNHPTPSPTNERVEPRWEGGGMTSGKPIVLEQGPACAVGEVCPE